MRSPFNKAIVGKIHLFTLPLLLFAAGCATYIPPSGRADLQGIAVSGSMRDSFAAKPAAQFPASIAAVRVQTSNYRSYDTERDGGVFGAGKYSVITTKDVEQNSELERLTKLPNVGGFITLSRLLLPATLQSDAELREAAARLKADMLLIYTFETSFHDSDASRALTAITLGLSPTRTVTVNVTSSALLIDTRTGFIYAAFEANERKKLLSNAWESRESADRARRNAEAAAFKSLVTDFETNWPRVVERAKKGA